MSPTQPWLNSLSPLSIITGHYGAGKTTVALNLAITLAKLGKQVTVIDLDIVNPYFRSCDCAEQLKSYNIQLIAPNFSGTNLDTPSLPASVDVALMQHDTLDHCTILDVGGDDAGALALGAYAPIISNKPYDFFYILNGFRYLTTHATEALENLQDIERNGRLRATALIHNSNLGADTTASKIKQMEPLAEQVAKKTGLPLACCAIPRALASHFANGFGMDMLVGPTWSRYQSP